MKIALLSDPHIAADRAHFSHGQNMAANFDGVIQQLLAAEPDVAIVTGDCSYKIGLPADYETFEAMIRPLREAGIGIHLMQGNHDDPANMRSPVAGIAALELGPVTFILTNTRINLETTSGRLGEAQLREIADLAAGNPSRPFLILGHHQPELPRDDFKDGIGLEDTPALLGLADRTPNILAYIHGHTHSWKVSETPGGTKLVNLPSAGFVFQFKPGRPVGWALATITDRQVTIELRTLDPGHPEHGARAGIAL